jgi:hypothetical protein
MAHRPREIAAARYRFFLGGKEAAMPVTLKAGASYGFAVFLIGFAIGAIRVLLIVPRLGETAAVCLEAPIMLAASWQVSRWSAARFAVSNSVLARLGMGVTGFAALMALEFALAVWGFGRTPAEFLAALATLPGAIGLTAQAAVAFIPLLQAKRTRTIEAA